jgi:hypothetical protein
MRVSASHDCLRIGEWPCMRAKTCHGTKSIVEN